MILAGAVLASLAICLLALVALFIAQPLTFVLTFAGLAALFAAVDRLWPPRQTGR